MNSSAHLTTISSEAGTISEIAIGVNDSSKILTAYTNLPGETLLVKTKKNNLVTTKIVAAPYTNPKIKFNSALRTLTSSDGVESCENPTGDRSDQYREPV